MAQEEKDFEMHLKALVEMCARVNLSLKEEELFSQLLKRSAQILSVEGISILLKAPDADALSFYAVEGYAKKELMEIGNIPLNEGIAGWVYKTGKSVFLNDPYSHPKFLPEVDSQTGFKTRNLICVPLISKMRTMGVLEVVNKMKGEFESADLYFSEVIAGIFSIVLRNIGLFSELTHQKNLVQGILSSIPGGFIAIDLKEEIIEFNTSAGRILGYGTSVKNVKLYEALKMQKEICDVLTTTLKSGKTGNRLILETRKTNGQKLILGYGTILVKNPMGDIIGAGMIFQDLTQIQGLP